MIHDKAWAKAGEEAEKQTQSLNCLLLVGRVSSLIYYIFCLSSTVDLISLNGISWVLIRYYLSGDIFMETNKKIVGARSATDSNDQSWGNRKSGYLP